MLTAYSHAERCRLAMGKLLHTQSHIDQLVMGLMRGRMSRQALNEMIWIRSLVCNKMESNIPEKAIGDKMIISNDLKTVPVQLFFFFAVLTGMPTYKYPRTLVNQYFAVTANQITLFFFQSRISCPLTELFFFFSILWFFSSFSELLYVVTKPESSPWLKAYFHNFSVLFLYFYLLNVISHSLSFLRTLLSTLFAFSDSLPLFLYSFLYTHVWYWTPQSHVLCTWVKWGFL